MRCTYSLGRRTCRSEVSLKDEKAIRKFLCYEYEKNATEMCTKAVTAEWNHLVDIKDPQKALISINATIESAKLDKDYWKHFFKDIDVNSLECSSLQRQIKLLSILGVAALGDKKLKELTGVIDAMTQIYGTARVCPYQKPHCDLKTEGLQLDPDLERIMATSRDYDELLYIWLSWREATGAKIKRLYEFYVVLSNDAATANNFTDMGQMWRNEYEYPAMESDLDRLWKEVSPLYEELHRYVLNRLRHVYGKDMPQDDDDLIPAHVLGNMWGQTWTNVRSLVRPYPRADDIDVTEALKKHKYTPHKMFEVANEKTT
ncbi:PREDICTED: angiotensin-converting enzyme-like [Nicrophorus vespilloides]|uniref:Angiotensin-converting enzyme-like n=1 Tax=Nicrophorus vespilloides TaxID=110193 RepID=A0ABM1MW52_NICVS|nr:PREDICTED: angiotensin-converting enzyme-like [Nicrophorus vespilloides]